MFCDGCGATLNAGSQFCTNCGKRVIPAPGQQAGAPGQGVPQARAQDRVRRHIATLAILWLAYGILRGIGAVWVFAVGRTFLPWIMGSMGGHGWPMGPWGWNSWIPFGLYTAGTFAVIFAAAYLLLAWGLHEKQSWARILGIVLGFLVLLSVPFGTALGIYTLWVLLPGSSGKEYEQMAKAV